MNIFIVPIWAVWVISAPLDAMQLHNVNSALSRQQIVLITPKLHKQ